MKRSEFLSKSALAVGSASLLACTTGFTEEKPKNTSDLVTPPRLVVGDTIVLFAPAGAVFNQKYVASVSNTLRELGFKVELAASVKAQFGYFSMTDIERGNEINSLFQNKEYKAMIAMRGGWGCARLLEYLDLDAIKSNPKIVMGYSDLTSLLNYITQQTGLITYHGIMGYSTWNWFAKEQFKSALMENQKRTLQNPENDRKELATWQNGSTTGNLIGGNLSVLVTLIGTPYEPIWKDGILFLEETHEEPYSIDRMLFQLKAAGVFEQLNGVVLGKFNDCVPEDPEKSFSLSELLHQYFDDFKKPIYVGASFGHVLYKWILPIGVEVEMNADEFWVREV